MHETDKITWGLAASSKPSKHALYSGWLSLAKSTVKDSLMKSILLKTEKYVFLKKYVFYILIIRNIWVFEIVTILANLSGLMLVMLGIMETLKLKQIK